jgi:hypothetical protein
LQCNFAVNCADPSTVLLALKKELHSQIVWGVLTTCEWIKVFDQDQVAVTAPANVVEVEAIPKFAENVASPSTATPAVNESTITGKTSVFPESAVKVILAAAVLPEKARVGANALSIEPVIDPVTSIMPTARLRVEPPKAVMSTAARVKLAVQDLIFPPSAFANVMLPFTPLIPAIVILP